MATPLTPLLATMSKAARFAWPFINKAAAEGLGATEMIAALKRLEVPTFRRQDMLALIREATQGELLKSDIARWPKDVLFPISRVRESVTKIVAPFSYTLRVSILDEDGNESFVLRQAHSSELRNLDDIANEFLDSINGREQYQDLDIQGAEVVDIQRAGTAGVI